MFLAARDVFVPHVREVEVWLGFELRGWAALATAPLHWAIFAVGAWGFARRRPWIWPAATAYAVYVAVSHAVWNVTSPSGGGWAVGLVQLVGFLAPAGFLYWLGMGRSCQGRPPSERGGRPGGAGA